MFTGSVFTASLWLCDPLCQRSPTMGAVIFSCLPFVVISTNCHLYIIMSTIDLFPVFSPAFHLMAFPFTFFSSQPEFVTDLLLIHFYLKTERPLQAWLRLSHPFLAYSLSFSILSLLAWFFFSYLQLFFTVLLSIIKTITRCPKLFYRVAMFLF